MNVAVRVDPRIQSAIPPLRSDELAQLEQNILQDGCYSPLIVWGDDCVLLDGHNRYDICTRNNVEFDVQVLDLAGIDAALAWVEENQLGRRNLTADQFAYFIGRKYERQKKQGERTDLTYDQNDQKSGTTAEVIGREHGLSAPTVRRAADYANNVDAIAESLGDQARSEILTGRPGVTRADVAEAAEQLPLAKANGLSFNSTEDAFAWVRRQKAEEKRERQEQRIAVNAEKAATVPSVAERYRLVLGSVDRLLEEPEASVDFVVTDPPYPEEFLPLFGKLATGAAHILKPGGLLLCMSGQSWLPQVITQLDGSGLDYLWTLAYLTPGGQATQVFPRKVNTFWKPVIVYCKGAYTGEWYGDVTKSDINDNDKRHHHWGQSESGMFDLMKRFVVPGDTVADPFLGGGTTAIVALSIGASVLGFDIDQKAIDATKARIADGQI